MKYRKKLGYGFREFGTKESGIFYKLKNMKNMDKISITLEGKEYQIDIQKAKELGILEDLDTRCKSWEEFSKKYSHLYGYRNDVKIKYPLYTENQLTQDEALSLSAFSKLLKLRRDWIGTWEPDWTKGCVRKYYIEVRENEFFIDHHYIYSRTFSFPTKEMAKEFLECFKHLFEDCKYLI